MSRWIVRHVRWLLLVPPLAVGLYALAGFWLVPKIVRAQASAYAQEELGKSLTLGEIRFNPFTFRAQASDIAIADVTPAQATPLVALKQLVLDFQIASLWRGAYTFRQVQLEQPYLRAEIRRDGSLNLADLLPKDRDDAPPPAVWIEQLDVGNGRIDFRDLSRSAQPRKQLAPITFHLRDFRTGGGQGGQFKLNAAGDDGERFDWQGQLSLSPLRSQGNFDVRGLGARTVYDFIGDALPMQLSAGTLGVAGHYRFAAGGQDGLQLDAELQRATAQGLAVRPKQDGKDALTMATASLSGTRFSLARRQLSMDAVHVRGLQGGVYLEADGSLSLSRLLPVEAPASGSPSPPWQVRIGKLDVVDSALDLEDRVVRPTARFRLQPLAATAQGISLDLQKPVPITVDATVNGKARLALRGDVVPDTTQAKLQLQLDNLPLRDVLAYLPDFPKLELASGEVSAQGELNLPAADSSGPQLAFDGQATVQRFALRERGSGQNVVAWQRVDAQGVRYRQAPESLSIERLQARDPFAIVVVAPDRTLNLVSLFAEQAPASAQSGPPMAIRVGDVQISNGTMAFADQSIDPNFSARILALQGHVRGLSTSGGDVASVKLDGHVINRYSPVHIEGGLDPFAYDRQTDLTMSFRNIDLPIFNPYSGRFAGYAIAKGKLSTELHYQIRQRQLEAAHHVVLDQLEWGQATDSKEKVSLPIRLATSLLKDRDGVIDLNLPVTGSLDDPRFRMWPIVWQILKNILVKVVTAPFDFIGSLFKGAENARYVDFPAGSPVLAAGANESLSALAQGMAERPALRLDIPAGAGMDADAQALAEQGLEAAVAALRKGDTGALSSLDAKEQVDWLEKLYKQQLGQKPELPKPEAGEDEDRAERKAARAQAQLDWLRQALLPRYQPDAQALAELGRARANAVQEALLASGSLDPARVFIDAAKGPSEHEGRARLELGLE